jgi:hypothetical protein
VAFLGGADEIVIGAAERPSCRGRRRSCVRQFDRLDAFLFRSLLHLLAVFVGACQEEDILAVMPLERARTSVAIAV